MSRKGAQYSLEAELLADVVQSLAEEGKVLRNAIDELREELQWANDNVYCGNNGGDPSLGSRRIHSFSLDPTKAEFAVNTVGQGEVDTLHSELVSPESPSTQQKELFS